MSLKFSIDDLTDPQLSPEMKGYIATVEANTKNKVAGAPNPFVVKGEFQRLLAAQEKSFDTELKKQQDAVTAAEKK